MTILKYLRLILLSFHWHLPFAKKTEFIAQTEIIREMTRREFRRKKLKSKREKLPPIKRKIALHQGFRSSKAKDSRFSDQRKLRRMYRGV